MKGGVYMYLDPGIFGMIAQIGYVVLFGFLAIILAPKKAFKALIRRLQKGK